MEYFKPPEFGKSDDSMVEAHEVAFDPGAEDRREEAQAFELKDVEEKKRVKRAKKIDHSQFSSSEFNEVDSLLTNVEEYTKRIREDAERYVYQIREEIDLLKSEIELELANALIKKLDAERKGQDLIRSAEESKLRVQKSAWEEGFQTGYVEGFKKFKEENDEISGNVLSLLSELQGLRLNIFQEYEKQMVRMSLLIAKKVVHNNLKSEPDFVLGMLKKAMGHFEGMGNINIRLNPAEYEYLKDHQPELTSFFGRGPNRQNQTRCQSTGGDLRNRK